MPDTLFVYICDRVNLVWDFLVLRVYQEYRGLKVSLDQREILVSPEALVHQDGLEMTEFQDSRVFFRLRDVF